MTVTHSGLSQCMVLTPIQPLPNWSFEIVKLDMFTFGKELQVLNPVIRSVMVPMVNFLTHDKMSTEVLFHYQSMFQNIAAVISMRMIRRIDCYVPASDMSSSSFPIWVCISHIVIVTDLKVTCITMSTNEHYWLMFFVIPTAYFSAATTRTIRQELSNGGQGL